MLNEKKRKYIFASLILGSIVFFVLFIILYTKDLQNYHADTFEKSVTSQEEINPKNITPLSDYFNLKSSQTDNNSTLDDNSRVPNNILIKPKTKTGDQSKEVSCEVYGQNVPEGVVIYDTTCAAETKDK